jgi:two-component system NarL family sensor kinase
MHLRLEACLDEAQETAPALTGSLGRLHELVGHASADNRRLVHDLRPPALDQLGLLPTLREYTERFGAESGIAVSFTAEEGLSIPAAAEVALLRVVQGALVNVQKHAQATRACLDLRQRDGQLVLAIRDDGVGLPGPGRSPGGGTGLESMSERIDLLGGCLEVTSPPEGGTALLACIPIRSEN